MHVCQGAEADCGCWRGGQLALVLPGPALAAAELRAAGAAGPPPGPRRRLPPQLGGLRRPDVFSADRPARPAGTGLQPLQHLKTLTLCLKNPLFWQDSYYVFKIPITIISQGPLPRAP